MDKNVYIDIKNALLRINGIQKNISKQHHSYSAIYPFTNENIEEYYKKNEIQGKDVLTVCSSGDHLFNAMLLDAKSVDCFDINRLSKYYMCLKMAGINCLNYDEFLTFFTKNNKCMDKSTYKIIRDVLENDIKYFWDEVFSNKNGKKLRKSTLFSKDENYKKNIIKCNNYLKPENYYILKNKISKYNPKFLNLDIKELPKNLDKQYDLIYLSNIVKSIDEIFEKPGLIEYKKFLSNELSKNLKENGLIFLAYMYDYLSYDDGVKWYNRIDNYKERKETFGSNEFETRIFNSPFNSFLCENNDAVIVYKKELDKR
ncbi:MAG: DUF3419 family protein [Bacilli bacterium]|nr:DUF3419 family protein [Bacilli bacterium]